MAQVKTDSALPALERVVTSALQYLQELGYSARTRRYYQRAWILLVRFARKTAPLSPRVRDLAADFLASCGIAPGQTRDLTWSQNVIRCALRILIEFQETGGFRLHDKRTEEPSIPSLLRQELERYEGFCNQHLHHRTRTLATRRRVVTAFLAFLAAQGVTSPAKLRPALLSAFIAERARHVRPRSLATEVGGMRSFLRFLCMRGLIAADLVAYVRALRFSKEHRLPPVWPPEAVEALLGAVDRSSRVGKRDYAILLLAARLGLRACDIRGLKLDNLRWAEARLSLTQSKTGRALSLPLSEELGQALIDYLRHARPRSPHREVFLKARPPFEPFAPTNPLYAVITTTLRRANISLPPGMPRGVHSLRHTLATGLVQTGKPLESVAAILGHRSIESTRLYTHLDLSALRSVALDPEEVLHG
jgi:site-specific recombinase XerD